MAKSTLISTVSYPLEITEKLSTTKTTAVSHALVMTLLVGGGGSGAGGGGSGAGGGWS